MMKVRKKNREQRTDILDGKYRDKGPCTYKGQVEGRKKGPIGIKQIQEPSEEIHEGKWRINKPIKGCIVDKNKFINGEDTK